VLIRADAAGCAHELLNWQGRAAVVQSVGFTLPDTITDELAKIPEQAWQPANDPDGELRPGAGVLDVTGLVDLLAGRKSMRVIVRHERPHPGAQVRLTDRAGHRLTGFATNTAPGGPVASSPISNYATAVAPAPKTAPVVGLDRRRADLAGQHLAPVPGLAATTAAGLANRFGPAQWAAWRPGPVTSPLRRWPCCPQTVRRRCART
jgi:hypothetical protein